MPYLNLLFRKRILLIIFMLIMSAPAYGLVVTIGPESTKYNYESSSAIDNAAITPSYTVTAGVTRYTRYITDNTADFNSITYAACGTGDGCSWTGTGDTCLQSDYADGNWGGAAENDVHLYGATEKSILLSFPGLSNINASATVVSVQLGIYQAYSQGGTPYNGKLHKVKVSWVEGTDTGGNVQAGSVDWNHRVHDTTSWQTAGCNGANDREATESAEVTFPATDTTWVTSTAAGLASDVQAWITNSATNFGWLLKVVPNDPADDSLKRFAMSENTGTAIRPYLKVVYDAATP